jgi:hypothetical protein
VSADGGTGRGGTKVAWRAVDAEGTVRAPNGGDVVNEFSLDRSAGMSSAAESAGFWSLFLTQTVALVVIGAYSIPLRRLLFTGAGGESAHLTVFCAAALMQICYWSRRRFLAFPSLRRDDLSGHMLLFLARILFVGAAACLPLAFFVRGGGAVPSPLGVILVPIALFAVFCYAWELERLARTRLDPFRD